MVSRNTFRIGAKVARYFSTFCRHSGCLCMNASTAYRSAGSRAPSAYAINTSSDTTDTTSLHCPGRLDGRPIDCIVDRQPRTRQSAHDGTDGHLQHFGGFLIGEAVHTYQGDQHTRLRRELFQSAQDRGELQPVFHDRAPVAADQHVDDADLDRFATEPVRTLPV